VTWRVVQLLNRRTTPFPITAALYSVQLCRENAVNADWSVLVYATKLQRATQHVTLAIRLRDKIARKNCMCDISLVLSLVICLTAEQLQLNTSTSVTSVLTLRSLGRAEMGLESSFV